jgi:hypothetical protein
VPKTGPKIGPTIGPTVTPSGQMPPMRKTLDRTFDLREDGLAATYRIRLYETIEVKPDHIPERWLLTSWELHQPGLPLDAWMERMADQAFDVLHGQGNVLTLVEFFPQREYRLGEKGENTLTLAEEIRMARIQPQEDGGIALLDFGEMTREEIEARIGESLTAASETTAEQTGKVAHG